MIKATKKDLEKALDIVCKAHWVDSKPDCKCENCIKCTSDECAKCWKEFYINLAKEELKNEQY